MKHLHIHLLLILLSSVVLASCDASPAPPQPAATEAAQGQATASQTDTLDSIAAPPAETAATPAIVEAPSTGNGSGDEGDEGEWVTLLRRQMKGRRFTPEPFRSTSDSLRVITTMAEPITRYARAMVITNILSDHTSLPVASIRAEQIRLTGTTVDTTDVNVPAGDLQLFIAQQVGLTDWEVELQELRRH